MRMSTAKDSFDLIRLFATLQVFIGHYLLW